jgi:hypothetical protein
VSTTTEFDPNTIVGDPNTSVGDVLYGDGGKFFLRPDYDAVVARLGVPPLGVPAECQFSAAWPDSSPFPEAAAQEDEPVAVAPVEPAPRRRAAARQALGPAAKRSPAKRAPKAVQ